MAKFNDLQIPQLKKEPKQRGLATNGIKSELQSRLREAMKAENINVDKYVFQLQLEEDNIEEKEEIQCSSKIMDINMFLIELS